MDIKFFSPVTKAGKMVTTTIRQIHRATLSFIGFWEMGKNRIDRISLWGSKIAVFFLKFCDIHGLLLSAQIEISCLKS
jgi:hypothetical protein